MDFMDAKILELRREQELANMSGLQDGAVIKGVHLTFDACKLFDGRMSIMLPTSFVDMPTAIAKMKYPSEQRPQIIKTSLDTTVNFSFSLLPQPIKKEQVKEGARQFKLLLQRVNPAYIFYDTKEIELPDNKICWFDFKSFAIDDQMYNIMFITPVDGKLLHGVFNCLFKDMEEWRPVVEQVIATVKINDSHTPY